MLESPPEGTPLKVNNLADQLPNLRAPLLGLFGSEDKYPASDEVGKLEQILKDNGKNFEFHSYEGAGHAFFAVDRPSYRPEAANDGWERIENFYSKFLGAQ